ncbi:hypothetical protein Q9L42_011375 [Methylomarinum sp. Ch1-1]|uniref:PepSY domain-containing protein n=2 Tax=Methylomarinum roseum TaxID=3067653 RepID=A0AAU7P131_9GAMM|nr:hypothetical protein [Methylomarinum sp. Ch1-1]MDP4521103.1 hypothetical protein [Methylomarinum sp. Ch1-1]
MRQILTVLLLSACLAPVSLAGTQSYTALVTLDEAARKIIQQGRNKVLATRTETVDGRRVHIIKILTPQGRIQHIKIDADSGRVVK